MIDDPALDPECCLMVVGFDPETGRPCAEWKISPYARSGDFDRDCYFISVQEMNKARAAQREKVAQ